MNLLLASIALVSVISLCSWWYCWRNVLSGQPNILSLRQVTLIMDRNLLDALYGKHGPGYIYTLNPHALRQIIRSRRLFVYGEMLADAVCFIGAWRYFGGMADFTLLPWFLAIAITYQALSVWYSLKLIRSWWHQIEEEMDNLR